MSSAAWFLIASAILNLALMLSVFYYRGDAKALLFVNGQLHEIIDKLRVEDRRLRALCRTHFNFQDGPGSVDAIGHAVQMAFEHSLPIGTRAVAKITVSSVRHSDAFAVEWPPAASSPP